MIPENELWKYSYVDAYWDPKRKDNDEGFGKDIMYCSFKDDEGNLYTQQLNPVYEFYRVAPECISSRKVFHDMLMKNREEAFKNIKEYNELRLVPGSVVYGKPEKFLGIDNVWLEKVICDSPNDLTKKRKEAEQAIDAAVKSTNSKNLPIDQGLSPIRLTRYTYEARHSLTFKTLIRKFSNPETGEIKTPDLKVGFFDIETDVDDTIGFPKPNEAPCKINAITFYIQDIMGHNGKLVSLILAPSIVYKGNNPISSEEALKIGSQFENTEIFFDEKDLLNRMIEIINQCDVISGWNSEAFDIPYIINRIDKVLGKGASGRLNAFDLPVKLDIKKNRDGKDVIYYRLIGRCHVDYMKLYKKHSPKTQLSYKLDYIAELEVKSNKVKYDGGFADLYNLDFRKFIEYNRQDTMLLKMLDDKLKYMNLTSALCHQFGVLLDTMEGTVAWEDQAFINYAHELGLKCPDKLIEPEPIKAPISNIYEYDMDKAPAPGGWVPDSKLGLLRWIGDTDINSLYPSTIRSLNLSLETIVAQIDLKFTNRRIQDFIAENNAWASAKDMIPNFALAWENKFCTVEYDLVHNQDDNIEYKEYLKYKRKLENGEISLDEFKDKYGDPNDKDSKPVDYTMTIRFENGDIKYMTGKELYYYLFDENKDRYDISAYGTIFRKDVQGIIPGIFGKWYSERKKMQKKMKFYKDMYEYGIELPEDLVGALNG